VRFAPPVISVAMILILSCAGLRADVSDAAGPNRRTITVQGEGKVHAIPDIATISIEVRQDGEDLDSVTSLVRHAMGKILESVKAQKIDDKDIQTDLFSVHPKLEYDKHSNPRHVGYSVTNRIHVKVRDLKKVGKVLTAVTADGVTSVNGPDFDVDNPQVPERQALALAYDDAHAKASALAEAAGVHLGQILSMTPEASSSPIRPRPLMMRAMAMPAAVQEQEPISAGEQTISATVTVVYALQ